MDILEVISSAAVLDFLRFHFLLFLSLSHPRLHYFFLSLLLAADLLFIAWLMKHLIDCRTVWMIHSSLFPCYSWQRADERRPQVGSSGIFNRIPCRFHACLPLQRTFIIDIFFFILKERIPDPLHLIVTCISVDGISSDSTWPHWKTELVSDCTPTVFSVWLTLIWLAG